MAFESHTDYTIRDGSQQDLQRIFEWLKSEWDDGSGEGFWGNRNMIEEGQAKGDLTVLVRNADDEMMGFLLSSDRSMDIMEIKPEFRRQGCGQRLAEHGLCRIERSGRIGIVIECMPRTSIPFWEALGFSHVERPWGFDRGHYAVRMFTRQFELPAQADTVPVQVTLCSTHEGVGRPTGPFTRRAAEVGTDEFQLDERIAAFLDDGDGMVKLELDGRVLYEGKVKYATDHGVEYADGFVRIDRMRGKTNGNE